MTFCLGIKTADGLIGLADTRVTTGTERITARKVTIHQYGHHSMFVMTSGLRSVRDKALTYFDEVIEESDTSFDKVYKAVNAFAQQIRRVADEDKRPLEESGFSFNLHSLVGGQLEADTEHRLFLLYPQGIWVEVSRGSPFYIIGESGYGKPLLDRVLTYDTPMELALKAGFLAFDATRTSATDVDFPLDIVAYRSGTYHIVEHRYERSDLEEISQWWLHSIQQRAIEAPGAWMDALLSKLETVDEGRPD